MLQNLSKEIRECVHRAEECKRLSKIALTPSPIQDYLVMEQHWLSLASATWSMRMGRRSQGADPTPLAGEAVKNYGTYPLQKTPQISPIFKADSVTAGGVPGGRWVSRDRALASARR